MKRSLCALLIAALLMAPAVGLGVKKAAAGAPSIVDAPSDAKAHAGYSRKDPILAGALSWYVPGLGQMYSGSVLKGAAFFVVEETLLVSTVLIFAEIELDVTGNVGLGINIKSKSNPDRDAQSKALILGLSLIAVHFINIIDAVNTARKYNRTQGPYLSTGVKRGNGGNAASIAVNKPF